MLTFEHRWEFTVGLHYYYNIVEMMLGELKIQVPEFMMTTNYMVKHLYHQRLIEVGAEYSFQKRIYKELSFDVTTHPLFQIYHVNSKAIQENNNWSGLLRGEGSYVDHIGHFFPYFIVNVGVSYRFREV